MLSKKSYFNAALFWDDIRRFSPIWVCATLATMLFPFAAWMRYHEFVRDNLAGYTTYYNGELSTLASVQMAINEILLDCLSGFGPILLLVYAALPAMALLHYLYQSRSALGVHALPITRLSLFVTHYLAGIAMIVLPLFFFCVVTIPVLLIIGAFWPITLLIFCAGAFFLYLFYFSFAVFCGMFTGQLWGLPVFYAIFNGIAPLTFLFFTLLAQEFLFGFSTNNMNTLFVECLTPVWHFSEALWLESITTAGTVVFHGLGVAACYGGVGIVFAVVAYAIFSSRHLERAGEIVSVGIVRPLFTFCLGLYGGFCLLMLFSYAFELTESLWLFFFLLLGTAIGVIIARMLLEKSLAVFSLANAKQIAAIMVLSCLCFATVRFDLLGYASYLPDAEDIDAVTISTSLYGDNLTVYLYEDFAPTATTDPDIALLRAAHAAILADYEATKERYPSSSTTAYVTAMPETAEMEVGDEVITTTALQEYQYYESTTSVDFTYTLTSGQKITRSYYIRASESELARQGSPLVYLEEFVSDVSIADLMNSYRDNMTVSMRCYDQDNYQHGETGTKVANGAIDAVLADLEEQGTTLSLLSKNYTVSFMGYINANLYSTETNQKGEYYSTYRGYFDYSFYPGSYSEAYLNALNENYLEFNF